jgi:hypothetical protein
MKRRRSHLALMGVLALALGLIVGLASGSVADAKKGKKKGLKAGPVTISSTTPIALPPATAESPTGCGGFIPPTTPCAVPPKTSLTPLPLTVGKKAKNMVVSLDSVSMTYTITGSPRTGAGTTNDVPAAASNVGICLTAPNGRTACAVNPGDLNSTTIGPVTETPDSPFGVCPITFTGTNGTQTICGGGFIQQDPENTVGPPTYAGTIGNNALVNLGGVPAKGTWTFKLRNSGTKTSATVSNVSATIGLAPSPTSSSKKKK